MAFTKATYDYLDSGGLINWQLTAQTATFDAVSGEGYLVDTSSTAVTVTLPDAPSAGDEIIIVDYASNAGTNNITIDPGTLNLRGATDDLVLSTNNQTARLLYSGATKGWLVTTEAGAGAAAAAPAPDLDVYYLVVAGGGGGGSNSNSGGGGAGGYRTNYLGTALSLTASTNYTVSVGPGGSITTNANGSLGGNSTFDTISSSGGGGGARQGGSASSGGSGGGGAYDTSGASGNAGSYTPVEGYAGGNGVASGSYPGGGGGGASEAGNTDGNGHGGDGQSNAITGSSVTYAGGGSGGVSSGNSVIPGGDGGGGDGSNNSIAAVAGSPNTGGGGGGGAGGYIGAAGGSGVVILRYPDAYSISETTSPTVLTYTTAIDGSDKVTTFTAGQSGTIQFST